MNIALVAALAVSSIALSGCITSQIVKMTPEQQIGLINAAASAGCSGTLSIRASGGTAAGVSPGSASGSFEFTGGCDPTKARGPRSEGGAAGPKSSEAP